MPGHAFDHLGDFVICQVVYWLHLNPGALHTLLVCHLADVGIDLINRQARAGFQVA